MTWFRTFKACLPPLAVVVCLVSAPDAFAQRWYENYESGLDALRDGDLDTAVESFDLAINARPDPGSKVRTYGMTFVNYYPYYYLGKAHLESGRLEKARQLFEQSRALQELRNAPDLTRVRTADLARIEEELNPSIPSDFGADVTAAIALGEDGSLRVSEEKLRVLRNEILGAGNAEVYLSEIDDALRTVRQQIVSAERDLAEGLVLVKQKAYGDARTKLARAATFDVTEAEATRALSSLDKAESEDNASLLAAEKIAEVRRSLDRADLDAARVGVNEAKRLDGESKFSTEISALERRLRNLRAHADDRAPPAEEDLAPPEGAPLVEDDPEQRAARLLDEASQFSADMQIRLAHERVESAAELAPELPEMLRLRDEVRRTAQLKARSSVVSLLQGRYPEAISALEDSVEPLSEGASIHLYLALAYYYEYLRGGEEDETLLETSGDKLARALALNPDVAPDRRLISPRFISFFERIRGGETGRQP